MLRRICRFIFSRYFLSAALIVLELAFITVWALGIWEKSVYVILIGLLINLIAVVNLIIKDTNPEYKIPWLIVLIALPFIGTVMYVLFFSRPLRRREARFLMELYREIEGGDAEENGERVDSVFEKLKNEDELVAGKALSILNDDVFARVYQNTSSEYFPSGEEFYASLLEKLETAEKYVFLEYFIIGRGVMWDGIRGILERKARLGVEVRVIYDDIGCMKTLPEGYELKLRKRGISCYRFNRITPSLSTTHNNRNHRKICVIDGKYAYTGGINIADEYINAKQRFGHWKDSGILIKGDAVRGLLVQFLCDWSLVRRKKEDYSKYLKIPSYEEKADTGYYLPFASGPKPTYRRPVGKRALLNVINQAKRYVYITTPYLVIDYELTEALRGAALRGVCVKIITPSIPDKKIVKVMTKSSYPYLMECGVKIYEYTPGFIHEKLVVCDDEVAIAGTINLDYRSLVHHFENALLIYSSATVMTMKNEFERTLSLSDERDEREAKLTVIERIIRNLVQVFAPLL